MLLKDRQHLSNRFVTPKTNESGPISNTYLTRHRYRRISAQGGRFVINNDNKGLLTRWHQVLGAFSIQHRVKTSAISRQFHLQPPYEMSQLTGASFGIFSSRAHVNNGASILVEPCKEAISRISSACVNTHQKATCILPVSHSILT